MVRLQDHWVVVVVAIMLMVASKAFGDPPFGFPDDGSNPKAKLSFSSRNNNDVVHLRRLQEAASIEASDVLQRHLDGGPVDPGNNHAARAATVLGSVRANGEPTIMLLCKNVTLQPDAQESNPADPLNGFEAAQALVAIGGARVADAVIGQLKQPLSEIELLLFARVLQRNDDLAITLYRLRLASERAKPRMAAKDFDTFVENLENVMEWLSDPEFAKNPRYSPK